MLAFVAVLLLQTTGVRYYPVPLDSMPSTTHTYVQTTGVVVTVSATRVQLRAGDNTLAVECVTQIIPCRHVKPGDAVQVFGKRVHRTTGWTIRPVHAIQVASPGMFRACQLAGVWRRCWIGSGSWNADTLP